MAIHSNIAFGVAWTWWLADLYDGRQCDREVRFSTSSKPRTSSFGPLAAHPYGFVKLGLEENQWEPLWNDVVRVAERVLSRPGDKHHPHFLGAVVLQQVQKATGQMQERTIIDGQQRLT